jgi:hypothetical protein
VHIYYTINFAAYLLYRIHGKMEIYYENTKLDGKCICIN